MILLIVVPRASNDVAVICHKSGEQGGSHERNTIASVTTPRQLERTGLEKQETQDDAPCHAQRLLLVARAEEVEDLHLYLNSFSPSRSFRDIVATTPGRRREVC